MRSRLFYLFAGFGLACGGSLEAATDAGLDGGSDANALPDATLGDPDGGLHGCWSHSFGTPALVAGLTTGSGQLSQDELTIYFSYIVRNDAGNAARPLMATRPSRAAPFGPAQVVPGLVPADQHLYLEPSVTADGLRIFFSEAYQHWRLLTATRPSTTDPFGPPQVVNGTAVQESSPYVMPDGRALYWMQNFRVIRSDLDGGNVNNVVPALGFPYEMNPTVSTDELVIFFSSTCGDCGSGTVGWVDIWTASRSSVNEPFGDARAVTEVNSPTVDTPMWISPDGCRLYMGSDRDVDAGSVWMAERAP